MVNYWLMITGKFENVATLQPQGGCDDPSFHYFFKLKCGSCGELTEKETCVALERSVQIPSSKGTANLVQKVTVCGLIWRIVVEMGGATADLCPDLSSGPNLLAS